MKREKWCVIGSTVGIVVLGLSIMIGGLIIDYRLKDEQVVVCPEQQVVGEEKAMETQPTTETEHQEVTENMDTEEDFEDYQKQYFAELKEVYRADKKSYLCPNSDKERLSIHDIWDDIELIKLARNEIYARHGYVFKNPDYQGWFENKEWYIQGEGQKEIKLSKIEQYNVAFLKWREEVVATGKVTSELEKRAFCEAEKYAGNVCFEVDINGDGKLEQVTYEYVTDSEVGNIQEGYLKINDQVAEKVEGDLEGKIWVIDIDEKDSYKELVIYDRGPSSDPVDTLYTYDGEKIIYMGEVEGHINHKVSEIRNYTKDGILHAVERNDMAGTARYNCDYKLNDNHVLEKIPTEYFETYKPVFLKEPVTVYEAKDMKSKSTVYPEMTSMVIIAIDKVSWYKVQLKSGEIGWVHDQEMAFDGLYYYD